MLFASCGLLVPLLRGRTRTSRAESLAMSQSWSAADWCAALDEQPLEAQAETIDVIGSIPEGLNGVLYKIGPAKFSRGGQRYAHWLEGDGAVLRLELGPSGALFSFQFVRTANFEAESAANRILTRGTFGTPRHGGPAANVLRLDLKNPANTHVAYRGGRLLAFSDVGLPYRLDARTLATLGVETFEGRCREGSAAATIGFSALDKLVGLGDAVTPHYRLVPRADSVAATPGSVGQAPPQLVTWAYKQDALSGDLVVRLMEFDEEWCLEAEATRVRLPSCGFPPHDFACTKHHALWLTSPALGTPADLLPYFLGRAGPAQCIRFKEEGTSTLHLVERRAGLRIEPPVRSLKLPPYHPVHFAAAYQLPPPPPASASSRGEGGGGGDGEGEGALEVLACCWEPSSVEGMASSGASMLGSWASISKGDFSGVSPQPLVRIHVDLDAGVASARRACHDLNHVDYCKVHPQREGLLPTYVWGSAAAPGEPGSEGLGLSPAMAAAATQAAAKRAHGGVRVAPPQSFVKIDLSSGHVVDYWYAGPRHFVDDFVLAPKPVSAREGGEDEGEDPCWLIAPVFDAATRRSSFVVLDASQLSAGPLCEAPLDRHVPWGLHGCWSTH